MTVTPLETPAALRIIVDGREADCLGRWEDTEEGRPISGYYYRFDDELSRHWIKGNSPRLGRKS
jgi:hypothetical protein